MTYKNLRHILVAIILILTLRPAAAQTPNFDLLKAKFDSGLVYKASFLHEFHDSYTEEVMETEGRIWIDHAGYKLESEDQTVVVDGETSRVYDSTRNRVIISEYDPEADDFAPSRMLNGVDSTYTIQEQETNNKGEVKIIMISQDDFAIFTRVEIIIDSALNPLTITAIDISDNKIVTDFTNGSFMKVEDSVFSLSYPEGAEIVDMRY